jgi:hypothetical protein
MELRDILTIIAIILGPILAIVVSEILTSLKEKRKRKVRLFETLMATRASRVSQAHVEALNMIDLTFYGDKKVIDTWKLYLAQIREDSKSEGWGQRCLDLMNEMFLAMSISLGFDIDKLTIKKGWYLPQGHGWIEEEQETIRKGFAGLFKGEKALPVFTPVPEDVQAEWSEIRKGLVALLKDKTVDISVESKSKDLTK